MAFIGPQNKSAVELEHNQHGQQRQKQRCIPKSNSGTTVPAPASISAVASSTIAPSGTAFIATAHFVHVAAPNNFFWTRTFRGVNVSKLLKNIMIRNCENQTRILGRLVRLACGTLCGQRNSHHRGNIGIPNNSFGHST